MTGRLSQVFLQNCVIVTLVAFVSTSNMAAATKYSSSVVRIVQETPPAESSVQTDSSAEASQTNQKLQSITGQTMGTYYSVTIDPGDQTCDQDKLQAAIEKRLAELNQSMSTWDSDSLITRFNQSDSTDWFAIDQDFLNVVQSAQVVFEASQGAFDPTLEPLIHLWGFSDRRQRNVPDEDSIEAAKSVCGMQHFHIDVSQKKIRKDSPERRLNLSAIAKGYAVDQLAQVVREHGFDSFVVDIGGENVIGEPKSNGDPWRLGVESPLGGIAQVLEVSHKAVATSGDYRNFFRLEGRTYCHAIDPKTGWPVENPPASVTVVAENCMLADAWATALMVTGVENGLKIAEEQKLAVMFQTVGANDVITRHASSAFEKISSTDTKQSILFDPPHEKSAWSRYFPILAAAAIFLIAIGGMAIGTILQNKSLKGSCGGLAAMPGSEGKSICELCTIPKDQCTNSELKAQMQAAAAARSEEEAST